MFWEAVNGRGLSQGDMMCDCIIPSFAVGFGKENNDVEISEGDLIVISQSCDLEQKKLEHVALCPVYTLEKFIELRPGLRRQLNEIKKGRVPALHMLGSTTNPADGASIYVVDFAHVVSLSIEFIEDHAEKLGDRFRLRSPYLEHFSQAFARFYMRVGLPLPIPDFQ